MTKPRNWTQTQAASFGKPPPPCPPACSLFPEPPDGQVPGVELGQAAQSSLWSRSRGHPSRLQDRGADGRGH